MKKLLFLCLICVIFYVSSTNIARVYCCPLEDIEFFHNGKVFTYTLVGNIKTSPQFDLNYEINKFNRFGTKDERIQLLNKMLELGFDLDISLEYLFPNLLNKLNSIEKSVCIKPQNAKLIINSKSSPVFNIRPEVVGISLDKSSLLNQICTNYLQNKPLQFQLPLISIEPSTKKKDYEKFTNLRADFSTNISNSSPDRKHNIKNALNSLDKIEIAPNEIFSFNKSVGKRTSENGYRQAKIIVNNEFVDGLGGGVCQVSSTLYNSALLAGLEIVEANKHSKQVSYVKYGFDAMVNFGSSDLKFRNNTNEKLIIITNYSSSTARIRIFGESNNNTRYQLSNEILNVVEPKEKVLIDEKNEFLDKVIYDDEFFYLKKGSPGMEIKSYREKYINGNFVSKELLRHDKFVVQDCVKVYGATQRTTQTINEKSTEYICA